MEWIQQFDEQVILWMSEHLLGGFVNSLMIGISTLGNKGLFFIILGIWMILVGYWQKSHWFYRGILLLAALGATALFANLILKPSIARIRPFDLMSLPIMISPPHDFSFPSGHTAAAFTTATVFCSFGWRWGLPFYIFALLMGVSRLYLLVHFPTDIIAGAVLGIAISRIVIAIWRKKIGG